MGVGFACIPPINFLPNYLFCGIYLSLPSPQPLSHRERGFFGLKHWHRFPAKSWFGKRSNAELPTAHRVLTLF